MRVLWRITNDADHFRVVRIAHYDDIASLLGGPFRKLLNLGYKRTSRINHFCRARFQVALNFRRHAMRPDDSGNVFGRLFRQVDG